MSPQTTVLITGASRGLGLDLVKTYLSRPSHTVLALARDPTVATLSALQPGPSSRLIPLAYDASSTTSAHDPVAAATSDHGISHIDIVFANAGIASDFSPVASVPLDTVEHFIRVNGVGPLALFQATLPLLKAARDLRKREEDYEPKFIAVGSAIGSIGGMEQRPFPQAAYGPSKAVLNWITRKIHFENEWLCAWVADPGFVRTDMGNTGARKFGMKEAYLPIEESVGSMVATADKATRATTGGKNEAVMGEPLPW